MLVTMLYFAGCPNWRTAEQRLREAVERSGRSDVVIARQEVMAAQQAMASSFGGSPTILVDGRDPFNHRESPVGLSCRVYATDGEFAGAPTVDQLIEALNG